ncbi:UNVERIFIED_CONTAM: hypothetical protein HDU68_010036, partial [Siphonaria sp. JEL0065]
MFTVGYNANSLVSYYTVNYRNTFYENPGWAPGPGQSPSDGGWAAQGPCVSESGITSSSKAPVSPTTSKKVTSTTSTTTKIGTMSTSKTMTTVVPKSSATSKTTMAKSSSKGTTPSATTTTTTSTTSTALPTCVDYIEGVNLVPGNLGKFVLPSDKSANIQLNVVTSSNPSYVHDGGSSLNFVSTDAKSEVIATLSLPSSSWVDTSKTDSMRLYFNVKATSTNATLTNKFSFNGPNVYVWDAAGNKGKFAFVPNFDYPNVQANHDWVGFAIPMTKDINPYGCDGPNSPFDANFNWSTLSKIGWGVQASNGFSILIDGVIIADESKPPCEPLPRPPCPECDCPLGYTGPTCRDCAAGFQKIASGVCTLIKDGQYSYWPNPVSFANSDPWLAVHHREIQLVKPNILVLNYANPTSQALSTKYYGGKYRDHHVLLDLIVTSMARGSQIDYSKNIHNATAPVQLQYNITKTINLRDDDLGPSSPIKNGTQYWENSSLMPRLYYPNPDIPNKNQFDLAALFSADYAKNYGYSDGAGGYLDLCTLFQRGIVHEIWTITGADIEGDALGWETLENKQVYNMYGNKLPSFFNKDVGVGKFPAFVPECGVSFKYAGINYNRGPGCFTHALGHGIEQTACRRDVVPQWSEWFSHFAGCDFDVKYKLPSKSLYSQWNNFTSGNANVQIQEWENTKKYGFGPIYNISNFDNVCGNVHFPPNAHHGTSFSLVLFESYLPSNITLLDYEYQNEEYMQSSCYSFGTTNDTSV